MSTSSSNTKKEKEKGKAKRENNAMVSLLDSRGDAGGEGEKLSIAPILQSMSHIRNLNSSLSTFTLKWEELDKHLDFILNAIDEVREELNLTTPQLDAGAVFTPETPTSELGTLAQSMDARGFRKYVSTHLQDKPELRKEITMALACAPKPGLLVLECTREVCRHGVAEQTKLRHLVFVQMACMLILAAFIESGLYARHQKEQQDQQDAQSIASIWKERLIKETRKAGLGKARPGDATGLLLFLSAFRLPDQIIGVGELYNLICASKVSGEIQRLIGSSEMFKEKFSDLLEWLQIDRKHIEAVDLAYAFENESMIQPLSILEDYLNGMQILFRDVRKDGQNTPSVQNDANERELAVLKSVIKCLKNHNLESAASEWNLEDKVAILNKYLGKPQVAELDLEDHQKAMAALGDAHFNQVPLDPARAWYQGPPGAPTGATLGPSSSSLGQVGNSSTMLNCGVAFVPGMPCAEQQPLRIIMQEANPAGGMLMDGHFNHTMVDPARGWHHGQAPLLENHFNQGPADPARGWHQGPPPALDDHSNRVIVDPARGWHRGQAPAMIGVDGGHIAGPGMPPMQQHPLPSTLMFNGPAAGHGMLPAQQHPLPPAPMFNGGAVVGPGMLPVQQHQLPPATPMMNPTAAPPPIQFNQAAQYHSGGFYQGPPRTPMDAAALGLPPSVPIGHAGVVGPGMNMLVEAQMVGQPLGQVQGLPLQPLPPHPAGPFWMPSAIPWQRFPEPNRFP